MNSSHVAILLLCLTPVVPACGRDERRRPAPTPAPAAPARAVSPSVGTRVTNSADPAPTHPLRERRIRFDSVPSGATVVLLAPRDADPGAKDRVLGKTPLLVDPSDCPGMRFWLRFDMDEFVRQLSKIPELKGWIERFELERRAGMGWGGVSDPFRFDTGTSQEVRSPTDALVAVGPVYELRQPEHDRICAMFVPRGMSPRVLFPLMPPPGTFDRLQGNWPRLFRTKYGMSDEQAADAEECLTRCGKYVCLVKSADAPEKAREHVVTIDPGTVTVSTREVWLVPGEDE